MNKKLRYSLIATILLIFSLLLFPGSHAQLNENTEDDGGLITQPVTATRPVQDSKPSGGSDEDVLPSSQAPQGGPNSGPAYVLVELTDVPAALIYAEVLAKSPHFRDKVLEAEAVRAAQSQSVRIEQQQRTLSAILEGSKFNAQELYRVHRALNGIAVIVDANKVDELRRLPGVKAVRPIEPEYPTNSTSVPFIGAPQVWGGPLGLNVKGDGIKIGIIDTGTDYQHADFGGTGLLADYQANNRTVAPDAYFPTAKVVGGYDFAGDAYTASNTPVPDPDPMDCNGHGTHVSGTAAGFGVKADGTTYTGPFTDSANYGALRIGPGSAPGASIYALRIFGCVGSTRLTVDAIDWAIDPNGDNDFTDHLDVINMSLGGTFGSIADTSALAADNAVLAGVIVVTSAGNSGDTFFIQGSPGAGSRVLSTAASGDSGIPGAGVRVNAPPAIAGNYVAGTAAFGNPPPPGGLTGNVVIGLDPADAAGPLTTDGCSPLTNAAAVAGNIALIDRGTCGFSVKTKNAQDAGAIAVIIANSAAGAFGNLGGTDPTITIPTVMVTFADGNTFKANIPGLNVTLFNGADTIASFSSRGPRLALSTSFASTTSFKLKPDITAPGLAITSAQTGVTCTAGACQSPNASGFIAGSQPLVLQGTSMASPHVTGVMALLRQLHPTWTVEELKALAMNGAIHDITTFPGGGGFRFSPSRIGAGRVDAVNSALSQVVAFNADEPGLVSLSFDDSVLISLTQTKKIRVVNNGTTAQTYDLGIDTVTDAPGVSFTLPGGSSVTVPAGATAEFDVQLSATASQMDHARDPTQSTTQVVNAPSAIANLAIPRHWLTEEGGYVTFSQSGNLKLRVPVYTAPRAASDMSAPATITTGGAPTGSTTIPLSGTDVCTGTLAAGPTCNGTFPNDEESLVSPFELQVVSPRSPTTADGLADLQYAGVSKDASRIWFGLSTWDKWSTPTDVSFSIYIDNNLDGTYDRIIFNTNSGTLARLFGSTVDQTDAFITAVFNPSTNGVSSTVAAGTPGYVNGVSANVVDTALYNNRVMFMGATPAQLGLANVNAPFRYKIETCPGFSPLCQSLSGFHEDEATGPYTWSGATQGLNFNNGGLLFEDLNGASIPVTWNLANMTANNSQGALLLHHHNVDGRQAEVVLVEGLLGTQSADLALSYSYAPPNPTLGQNVTLTLSVKNNGPDAATGIQVSDPIPPGLTYVSDDGGGTYDPATGQWTVGALANGASATLHIVVTVSTTDEVVSTAKITAGTPLDPTPADNQASITLMSPRQADLAMSMSVSSPTVLVGGSVTYTLTVTNNGDDPAYSLNVAESFPSYPLLNPTSYTASQGVYNPSTGVWNLASLGKGNSATLALTVTAPNIAGALTEQATASSGTTDPSGTNNTASATTTVLSPATVTGTKSRSGNRTPGATVTYIVTLTNSSTYDQQDNLGNEFTDVLPLGLTLVSATATSGTATPTIPTRTVTWSGNIPANSSVTITITATIDSGTGDQTLSNQGAISYDADGNGVNEASALTDDPSVAGASNPTSFVVLVAHVPTVTNATTSEDTQTTSGLVITPNAADGAEITVFKITGITGGSLFQNNGTTPINNGDFITLAQGAAGLKFTPTANSITAGSFQVQGAVDATGAGLGAAATATITVNPVPDTPSVTDTTTNEDTQTTTGLVISRNPVDGAEVTHFKITGITGGSLFQNNGTTPINNGDFITFAQGNAGLKFTPALNSSANGSFTVQASLSASDAGLGGGTVTATITVNPVNDAPTLDAIGNLVINEDAPLQTVNLAGISAGDSETQTLVVTATSSNTGLIPNPAVTYTSPNATGSLSFTPVANQNGSAVITVTVSDGGGNANGGVQIVVRTFTVTVNAVNDAPVNGVPGPQAMNTNTLLTFSAANGNAIIVSDIDADPVFALLQVTLTATNGTLSLAFDSSLVFTVGDGTADATMTFVGSPSIINNALNGMVFTPTTNFSGAASVQITTNDQGNSGAGGALSDTDTVAINVSEQGFHFSAAAYTVGEADGHATITVTREGSTASPASISYVTSDLAGLNNCDVVTGQASARCDYTAVGGTLNFLAGQSSLTFTVPIINDVYVEGPEVLTLTLSNPAGAVLGTTIVATLTITDDDLAPGATNPIDTRAFLVRQLYLDFLNREPEPSGLAAWLNRLNTCPQPGETLQNCDEIEVASAFFRSPESFDRGYFIYSFYEATLGRQPQYAEYQNDLRRLTGFLTTQELEQRKREFVEEFINRAEFKNRYDSQANGQPLVDAILATAGTARPGVAAATIVTANRQSVINRLNSSAITRSQGVRELVESPEISQRFYNKAFVVVGYFAFLRRNPDAAYLNWINMLNMTGDYRDMIRGFLMSSEYRFRFGPM